MFIVGLFCFLLLVCTVIKHRIDRIPLGQRVFAKRPLQKRQ